MSTIFELPETQLERRGHVFYDEQLKTIPPLYATEDVEAENKVIHAKFFGGSATWYVAELDPESGVAFGFCNLGNDEDAEWGYTSLLELESLSAHGGLLIIERDCFFEPTRFGDLER